MNIHRKNPYQLPHENKQDERQDNIAFYGSVVVLVVLVVLMILDFV